MSLKRQIAYNTIVQLVGKTISTILGLIAVALLTRSLGVEQFGWYITASGFLQFIGIFTDFGFTVTTANLVAEKMFDEHKLINTLFTWRLITALAANALAVGIIGFFPYSDTIKLSVIVLSVSFLASSLNQVFIGFYQASLATVIFTTGEILGRAALIGAIVGVSWLEKGFLPIMVAVSCSSFVYFGYLVARYGHLRLSFNRAISRLMFARLWPTAIAIICNTMYLQGDRLLLPLYVSQTEVGLYGASYRVLDIVLQLAALLMGIMMPLIAGAWARRAAEGASNVHRLLQTSFDLVALFLLPAAAAIFVISRPIMQFVAGADFAPAGIILQRLSPAIIGITLGMTFGHVVLALNRQRQALKIYFTVAVCSLAAYVILLPRFGVNGAIIVTLFSEFAAGTWLMILACRSAKFWPNPFSFLKIFLASTVMAMVLFYCRSLPLFGLLPIGLGVYSLLVALFKVARPSTLREIFAAKKLPTNVQ